MVSASKQLHPQLTATCHVQEMQQSPAVDQTDFQCSGMEKTRPLDHHTTLELMDMDFWVVIRKWHLETIYNFY